MSATNLRAAAIESLQRTASRPRALASFVSRLQKNKVLLAALAEPYLNSVAESLVPVKEHVRSAPGTNTTSPQGQTNQVPGTSSTSDHLSHVSSEARSTVSDVAPIGSGLGAPASPTPPTPVPEPNLPRSGSIIGRIQSIVRKSIFDTYLLPDGRKLRNVRWRELPGLVERFGNTAKVLTTIMNYASVPVDTGQYVSDVVSEKVVLDAIEKEVGHADAA